MIAIFLNWLRFLHSIIDKKSVRSKYQQLDGVNGLRYVFNTTNKTAEVVSVWDKQAKYIVYDEEVIDGVRYAITNISDEVKQLPDLTIQCHADSPLVNLAFDGIRIQIVERI
jgi:hypothetical protein